ncbi:C-reactive protein-like [Rhinoderma darwinii]|uniref:C-reactive protein-like n=1 Tax=Rhinoderma darwinii TaxID=43563 RepID=UPI003F672D53
MRSAEHVLLHKTCSVRYFITCAVIHLLGPGGTGLFSCNGMDGRYVTVLLPDNIEKLSLCEVQVFSLPISSVGLSGTVLMFPEVGNRSYAVLQPQAPVDLIDFTLCLRVSTALSGRREVILFSYCNDGQDELNVWRELDGRLSLYLRSSSDGAFFSLPGLSTFGTHICVTWRSSSGVTSFWVNGKMSTRQIYRKGHNVTPGGNVILGQDQDICGGSFDVKQSFVGEISDVHLWNYVQHSSAIKDVYKNKPSAQGNVINWSSVNYSLYGNVVIQ